MIEGDTSVQWSVFCVTGDEYTTIWLLTLFPIWRPRDAFWVNGVKVAIQRWLQLTHLDNESA